MKNKIQKIWDFIFKNDPSLKNVPLHIVRKTASVDTKLQAIFLSLYLSTPSGNSPCHIKDIIEPSHKMREKNETK